MADRIHLHGYYYPPGTFALRLQVLLSFNNI